MALEPTAPSGKTDEQDFADDATGWAQRWAVELPAARKALEDFYKRGEEANRAYLVEAESGGQAIDRFPLFHADVETKRCMLYGRIPAASCKRRFADANDDVGRVAADIQQRMLNTDIERDSDSFATAIGDSLMDWLIPGLGVVRCRYRVEWEDVPGQEAQFGPADPLTGIQPELAPAVPPTRRKSEECVEVDYVHWRDFLYPAARVWSQVPWIAYGNDVPRRAFEARFPEAGLWAKVPKASKRKDEADKDPTPWSVVRIWEIWAKDEKRVFWWVEGYDKCLDMQADELGLDAFFPGAKPLLKNLTTSKVIPRSDYAVARTQYLHCEELKRRIANLIDSVRVAGIYDETNEGVKELLENTDESKLYPVKGWGRLSEAGGLGKAIDWLPLEQIIVALERLSENLAGEMQLLQQITGMADIMRGQGDASATATADAIKARFGSVRMEDAQREFARFASDTLRIKAEIISKHFDPATIAEQSNILRTDDAPLAEQAIALLKDKHHEFRVEVKPESIAMSDYAALKQERVEIVTAIGGLVQALAPALPMLGPPGMKLIAGLAKWTAAGVKDSSAAESVLDSCLAEIEAMQQQAAANPQPPQPDPKVVATQMKVQGDMAKGQQDSANRMQEIRAETVSGVAQEAAKHHFGIQSAEAKERAKALDAVNNVTGGTPSP